MKGCFIALVAAISLNVSGLYSVNTVVVTSATGELGKEICAHLAAENHLILIGRNSTKLETLQKELTKAFPHTYTAVECDFTKVGESKKKLENCLKQKVIDGVVLIGPRPLVAGGIFPSEADWTTLLQQTFIGPVELLKCTLGSMAPQSSVVVMAGNTSVQLIPEYGPACVIRRMWATYVKALSYELGPRGIRVNTLSPGVILTPFNKSKIAKRAEDAKISLEEQTAKERAKIPLRRQGEVVDVVQAVDFLLSDKSSFINGTNLVLDGGLSLSYQ